MLVADAFLGRRDDGRVADRLETEGYERITVDAVERRRSRFRTVTDEGTELGVVVDRELESGDVLGADGRLVVVELDAVAAFAVDLDGVEASFAAGAAFGHALGNRHRDLAVRGTDIAVRIDRDADRLERTLRSFLPPDAGLERTTVPPTVFDDGPEHDHDHGHAHDGAEVGGDRS